ncbi:hypothetical protein GT755_06200 [Herbidospora sp. NEAU-GS84]|uniref:Uncharacterized protein n=1 Tax=Herbidospora solisilvae TaxID=2696284 RepID=A0A7C9NLB3_9ACTN|nr:hypothetical protein [Herbidospora solisilvae]NAS21276.1 hypothetical protein [Herbidospora solisilvae]
MLTSLSPQEIRDYFGKAKIAGARHDAMISLYSSYPDAGESRFIVEFIDFYCNPLGLALRRPLACCSAWAGVISRRRGPHGESLSVESPICRGV